MIILRGENDYLGGRGSAEACARLGGGAVGAMVVNVEAQQKRARGSGQGQLGITFAAAEIRADGSFGEVFFCRFRNDSYFCCAVGGGGCMRFMPSSSFSAKIPSITSKIYDALHTVSSAIRLPDVLPRHGPHAHPVEISRGEML